MVDPSASDPSPSTSTPGLAGSPVASSGTRAGTTLAGRYRLVSLIASGGMAEVWEGRDTVLQRPVAVKVLHRHLAADEAFRSRFRTEALAAARLRHPSIVAIYDTCHHDGVEAIVMELVRGRTLRAYLDQRGRLDPEEVTQIGADVAGALDAAHRAGVVHRDIKPANILLCDDGRVVVTDFGIAKLRDGADLTTTGIMLGTVKYLAPEQVAGEPVDGRADQFSLAVVLYEALCGRPPFQAGTAAATALARLHHQAVPPGTIRPDTPPRLDAAIRRALARRPEDRFPTAGDLRAALVGRAPPPPAPTTAGADPTIAAAPPRPPASTHTAHHTAASADPGTITTRRSRRRWALATLVTVVVLGSLTLAALLVLDTKTGDDLLGAGSDLLTPAERARPAVTAVAAFDPEGDGTENDAEVSRAVDADPSTTWRTERYDTRDFGNLKDGVGLTLVFDREVPLQALRVESPSTGWDARVYVADRTGSSLSDWGDPLTSAAGIDGSVTFDLGGTEGRAVLLWITDLGDGPGRVEIAELVPLS